MRKVKKNKLRYSRRFHPYTGNFTDDGSVWEWTKFNIRDHAIQFSKKRARSWKDKEAQLEKESDSALQIY